FDTPVEFLKGVGPQRAAILNKELNIFSFGDLIQYYPLRYEDRTKFYLVRDVHDELQYVQVKGVIASREVVGAGPKKRLVCRFEDETGSIELVWFQGINWIVGKLLPAVPYVVFGKPTLYGTKITIAHPEIEPLTEKNEKGGTLQPVYSLTEKMRSRHFDSKALSKIIAQLVLLAKDKIRETLPDTLLKQHRLVSKQEAILCIHFPPDHDALEQARRRLKFEELFYIQLRLLKMKLVRQNKYKGI